MTRWSLFLQTLSLLHHFLGLYFEVSWTLHVIHDLHRNDVVMAAKTDTLYLAR